MQQALTRTSRTVMFRKSALDSEPILKAAERERSVQLATSTCAVAERPVVALRQMASSAVCVGYNGKVGKGERGAGVQGGGREGRWERGQEAADTCSGPSNSSLGSLCFRPKVKGKVLQARMPLITAAAAAATAQPSPPPRWCW